MDDGIRAIELSETQRAALAVLSDALIPPDEDFPSATAVDPSGRFIARAMTLIPRQAGLVALLLDSVDVTKPQAELHRLEREVPEAFEALLSLVFGTYFTNRKVWKRIGYPGRRPTPPYPDEADYFLAGNILAPVLERGPFFRPTIPSRPKDSHDGDTS